jgi:hypothetical protein
MANLIEKTSGVAPGLADANLIASASTACSNGMELAPRKFQRAKYRVSTEASLPRYQNQGCGQREQLQE